MVCLARMTVGEFGGHRLAHDQSAGAARQRHHRGVDARSVAFVYRRAVLGGHVAGVDDVFDAHRYALQ